MVREVNSLDSLMRVYDLQLGWTDSIVENHHAPNWNALLHDVIMIQDYITRSQWC